MKKGKKVVLLGITVGDLLTFNEHILINYAVQHYKLHAF